MFLFVWRRTSLRGFAASAPPAGGPIIRLPSLSHSAAAQTSQARFRWRNAHGLFSSRPFSLQTKNPSDDGHFVCMAEDTGLEPAGLLHLTRFPGELLSHSVNPPYLIPYLIYHKDKIFARTFIVLYELAWGERDLVWPDRLVPRYVDTVLSLLPAF